jgi:hypothetical protein
MANFLWLSNNKQSSKHWVAWSNVTKTKEEGGLGIRSLFDVLTALRCKRVFRLLNEDNSWANLMGKIHGHITHNYRNNKTPNRWKNLKNAWYIIEPYLAKQSDYNWTCTLTNNGTLTTHLAWNLCRIKHPTNPWGSHVWKSYIPTKISMLIWQILQNKLPTDDNLEKLNICLPSKCLCCSIFHKNETCAHLFFNSIWSFKAYHWFTQFFHIDKTKMGSWHSLCLYFFHASQKNLEFKIQKLTLCSFIWNFWITRCKLKFENSNFSSFDFILSKTILNLNNFLLVYNMSNSKHKITLKHARGKICIQQQHNKASKIQVLRWLKPPQHFFKLNT